MKFLILKVIVSITLLGILGYVITHAVDIPNLITTLRGFPPLTFFLLLCISTSISLLKAWRFLILLRDVRIPISFWETTKTYFAGQAITPLPGGEAARSMFLKTEVDASAEKTSAPIISQAFLELTSAAIVTLIGSFFLSTLRFPSTLVAFGLFLIALLFLNNKVYDLIFSILPKNPFFNTYKKKFAIIAKGLQHNFIDKDTPFYKKTIISTFLISIFAHILGGVLFMVIAYSYGVNFDIFKSIFVYTSSLVIQGLSISPGGIGLTEGGMIGILLLFDVPIEKALPIVLITRCTTLLYYILTGFIFITVFYLKPMFRR